MPMSSGVLGDGVSKSKIRNRLWPRMGLQNFLLLVQLLLPPLLEKCGEKMERPRRDWQSYFNFFIKNHVKKFKPKKKIS